MFAIYITLYLLSTLNVTHVIKSSRPSPAFHVMGSKVAYNKYARSGGGPGNEEFILVKMHGIVGRA